jgi:hypothetical protein
MSLKREERENVSNSIKEIIKKRKNKREIKLGLS